MNNLNLNFSTIVNKKVIVGFSEIVVTVVKATIESLPILSEREMLVWNDEKQFRRIKMDWLSGRISAKVALQQLYPKNISLKSIEIYNDITGIPYSDLNSIVFSISHSYGYGLCTAIDKSFTAIGCDIEKIKIREFLYLKQFVTQEELSNWKNKGLPYSSLKTLLWTIKEASIKCLSMAKITPETPKRVISEPIDSSSFFFRYDNYSGIGIWFIMEGMCVAICTITDVRRK